MPIGIAGADVLEPCPKSWLGATGSVPNGRGIGVLAGALPLCALGVILSGVDLPSLILWLSQEVCEALDIL